MPGPSPPPYKSFPSGFSPQVVISSLNGEHSGGIEPHEATPARDSSVAYFHSGLGGIRTGLPDDVSAQGGRWNLTNDNFRGVFVAKKHVSMEVGYIHMSEAAHTLKVFYLASHIMLHSVLGNHVQPVLLRLTKLRHSGSQSFDDTENTLGYIIGLVADRSLETGMGLRRRNGKPFSLTEDKIKTHWSNGGPGTCKDPYRLMDEVIAADEEAAEEAGDGDGQPAPKRSVGRPIPVGPDNLPGEAITFRQEFSDAVKSALYAMYTLDGTRRRAATKAGETGPAAGARKIQPIDLIDGPIEARFAEELSSVWCVSGASTIGSIKSDTFSNIQTYFSSTTRRLGKKEAAEHYFTLPVVLNAIKFRLGENYADVFAASIKNMTCRGRSSYPNFDIFVHDKAAATYQNRISMLLPVNSYGVRLSVLRANWQQARESIMNDESDDVLDSLFKRVDESNYDLFSACNPSYRPHPQFRQPSNALSDEDMEIVRDFNPLHASTLSAQPGEHAFSAALSKMIGNEAYRHYTHFHERKGATLFVKALRGYRDCATGPSRLRHQVKELADVIESLAKTPQAVEDDEDVYDLPYEGLRSMTEYYSQATFWKKNGRQFEGQAPSVLFAQVVVVASRTIGEIQLHLYKVGPTSVGKNELDWMLALRNLCENRDYTTRSLEFALADKGFGMSVMQELDPCYLVQANATDTYSDSTDRNAFNSFAEGKLTRRTHSSLYSNTSDQDAQLTKKLLRHALFLSQNYNMKTFDPSGLARLVTVIMHNNNHRFRWDFSADITTDDFDRAELIYQLVEKATSLILSFSHFEILPRASTIVKTSNMYNRYCHYIEAFTGFAPKKNLRVESTFVGCVVVCSIMHAVLYAVRFLFEMKEVTADSDPDRLLYLITCLATSLADEFRHGAKYDAYEIYDNTQFGASTIDVLACARHGVDELQFSPSSRDKKVTAVEFARALASEETIRLMGYTPTTEYRLSFDLMARAIGGKGKDPETQDDTKLITVRRSMLRCTYTETDAAVLCSLLQMWRPLAPKYGKLYYDEIRGLQARPDDVLRRNRKVLLFPYKLYPDGVDHEGLSPTLVVREGDSLEPYDGDEIDEASGAELCYASWGYPGDISKQSPLYKGMRVVHSYQTGVARLSYLIRRFENDTECMDELYENTGWTITEVKAMFNGMVGEGLEIDRILRICRALSRVDAESRPSLDKSEQWLYRVLSDLGCDANDICRGNLLQGDYDWFCHLGLTKMEVSRMKKSGDQRLYDRALLTRALGQYLLEDLTPVSPEAQWFMAQLVSREDFYFVYQSGQNRHEEMPAPPTGIPLQRKPEYEARYGAIREFMINPILAKALENAPCLVCSIDQIQAYAFLTFEVSVSPACVYSVMKGFHDFNLTPHVSQRRTAVAETRDDSFVIMNRVALHEAYVTLCGNVANDLSNNSHSPMPGNGLPFVAASALRDPLDWQRPMLWVHPRTKGLSRDGIFTENTESKTKAVLAQYNCLPPSAARDSVTYKAAMEAYTRGKESYAAECNTSVEARGGANPEAELGSDSSVMYTPIINTASVAEELWQEFEDTGLVAKQVQKIGEVHHADVVMTGVPENCSEIVSCMVGGDMELSSDEES